MLLRNILLAVGILALLAGVALAGLWLSQGSSTPPAANVPSLQTAPGTAAPAVPTVPANAKFVLTAAHAVVAGTLLRPDDIAWKPVAPTDVAPGDILRDKATETAYLGAIVRRNSAAGEALTASSLLKPTDRGFLSATLSPGSRAVSIAVDASQSASGLLLPDDRVDIILTQTFDQTTNPARKFVGETLLRNVRVIAIDRRLSPYDDKVNGAAPTPESQIPKTITLEVSAREAEMLMVANRLGKVDVAVRSLERSGGETSAQPALPVWASDVSAALNDVKGTPVPQTNQPAPAPAQRTRTPVEVMHGAKIEAH